MAIFGPLSTVRAQTARLPFLQPAFPYLEECFRPGSAEHERLAALAAGKSRRVELAGGAFAIEQVYETRARSEGFYESHRKYIDVQVLVAGEELMEVADISRLTVQQAYDVERDFILYADFTAPSVLRVQAGEAAVFFPEDGHMPSLRVDQPMLVRKAVVKIPVPSGVRW